MGGHQALTWATHFPDRVQGVIALATSPRLTNQALAFDVVGRNAIRRDPHYHGGQYYGEEHGPEVGLAIARMIGHITYLSRQAMTQKFEANRLQPRNVATEFEKTFSVGTYLGHQGAKFVERFDANSYMALSMAMNLFDLGATPAELAAAFRPTKSHWLVISFSSDWLFPPDQSRDIVNALVANNAPVSYCNVQSDCGHDAFLLPNEIASYGELIRAFLNRVDGSTPRTLTQEDESESGFSPTSIFHRRRIDYERIVELIPREASVLDLGCGRGGLLARLQQHGCRRFVGVELDEQAVIACVQRGLDVVQADLNKGLRAFANQQFDCVVLSQTLQAVHDVQGVINEILRVGRIGIVSFPNFAFQPLRRILAEEGRAPKSTGLLRYDWYNTPNIRFLSITDFEEFCREKSIHIHRRIALNTEDGSEVFQDPNLNADLAIFVISSASDDKRLSGNKSAYSAKFVEASGVGLHEADEVLRLENAERPLIGQAFGETILTIPTGDLAGDHHGLRMPRVAFDGHGCRVVSRDGDHGRLRGQERGQRGIGFLDRLDLRVEMAVLARRVGAFDVHENVVVGLERLHGDLEFLFHRLAPSSFFMPTSWARPLYIG